MSLMLVCPQVKKGASNLRSFLICIFSCPNRVRTKCLTYKQNYDKIVAEKIEPKYFEKHGQPDYTPPFVPRARKVRAVVEKPVKPKREKKAQISVGYEAVKVVTKGKTKIITEVKPTGYLEEVKPKRRERSDKGKKRK